MASVYLIASTKINDSQLLDWLMECHNPNGEADPYIKYLMHADLSHGDVLAEVAGRRCYRSFAAGLNPNVKKIRSDAPAYIENILKSGHGSVLEHVSGTFAVEKVTRVFTHELVRHRAGTAFSQESLRYVRLSEDLEVRIPDVIADDERAKSLFLAVEESAKRHQKMLAELFSIEEMKDFNQKKILTSAFRRIAPIGLITGIIFTANVRALRWMLEQRSSPHAEEEMQEVFFDVGCICKREWPLLFGDFRLEDDLFWRPGHPKV